MRSLTTVALGLFLAGCASSPTVHTDYNPAAQFGTYRTYSWLAQPEGGSPLTNQRIVAAIDAQLQAKGLRPTAQGGDVGVAAHIATQQKQSLDTFYTGPAWGGWGWRWGGMGMGSATTTVHNYEVGTLVVDMFDTKSKQAIWRGTASQTISGSTDDAAVNAAVTKMFASYPPGSAPAQGS